MDVEIKETEECGSHSIRNMLRYIEDSHICNVVDEATEQMNSYVDRIRNDAEMEGECMTFGDLLDQERAEGKIEGKIFVNKGIVIRTPGCMQRRHLTWSFYTIF